MKILIEESVLLQALEALEMTIAFQDANTCDGYAEHSVLYPSKVEADWTKVRRLLKPLRAAIEAVEKVEPVAWMWEFEHDEGAAFSTKEPTISIRDGVNFIPLYTHPAQQKERRNETI